MRPHHSEACEKAKARLLEQNPDLLAILVAGSIAKGIEREDSDVDLMVVLRDDQWRRRQDSGELAFLWWDVASWKGGYVEGRFLPKSFLAAAADRGSEPTRHSFTGVYPVVCRDDEIPSLLKRIPVYPEHDRARRIGAFMSQMQLNHWYFWGEAKRENDRYLLTHAATEIVRFGYRLILAHNRMLFPCQKRLVETVEKAPQKPENIVAMGTQLLMDLTNESKDAFYKAIFEFTDWGKIDSLGNFLRDVEMSWYTGSFAVSEW